MTLWNFHVLDTTRTRGIEVVGAGSKACVSVLEVVGMIVFHAELFILIELLPHIQVTLSQKTACAISTLAIVKVWWLLVV